MKTNPLQEHSYWAAKISCIAKDRFICHKFGFDDLVMELASGLHSTRIILNRNAVIFLYKPIIAN
jgi:hypothetical protein